MPAPPALRFPACWRRLLTLNPFEKDYVRPYYHALVRVRDFETLAAYTNDMPVSAEFTADEKALENLLFQGMTMARAQSNELAVACYVQATNLNYYAATPFLIDCHARDGNLASALHVARPYLRRFPSPELAFCTAEWSAMAGRPDLVEETRQAIPAESGYSGPGHALPAVRRLADRVGGDRAGGAPRGGVLDVDEAVCDSFDGRLLVWIWFSSDKLSTGGFLHFRRMYSRSENWHTYQVSTPVGSGDGGLAAARKRLQRFLAREKTP